MTVRSRRDLQSTILGRALRDDRFRRALVANPRTVVERELGTALPADVRISVVCEQADLRYLVLPANPYPGMSDVEVEASVGVESKEVARWSLEQAGLESGLLPPAAVVRSWRDPAFRTRLLAEPAATLRTLGLETPPGFSLRAVAETLQHIYMVLRWVPEPRSEAVPEQVTEFNTRLALLQGSNGRFPNPGITTHAGTCDGPTCG